MASATTNFMVNSAASHARGRADQRPTPPLTTLEGKVFPLASGETNPPLKAEHCRPPMRGCGHQWNGLSRTGSLSTSPKHMVLQSTWKWEARANWTSTRKDNITSICTVTTKEVMHPTERCHVLILTKWESGHRGEGPSMNFRGFHGKDIWVEKVLSDFGSKMEPWSNQIQMEPLASCCSELTVWRTLWPAPRRSSTGSRKVLITVLAAGIASLVLFLSSVRVLFLLFCLDYILLRECPRLKVTLEKYAKEYSGNRATWII